LNLVIVESPSKTKTIKQYLGKDYNVVASKGHIRDIENCGFDNLGIDINNDFKPIYEIIPRQKFTIKMLNSEVEKADNIYLATDPDREGEAISWHLNEVLNLENKTVKRIEFNEITKTAILNAIENPRDIDSNLFHSQETRKIMDRIIGYELSGLVKKTVGQIVDTQTTAGRVQSAALRIICDRENEIKAFIPETYYDIEADFGDFKAKLVEQGKDKTWIFNKLEDAQNVIDNLSNIFVVSDIKYSEKYERPGAPFTTSSLMQAALNKYNLNSKKTMKIAQELYEGINVDGKHIAFITYMRTDSTRLSEQFQKSLYFNIKNNFGEDYVGYLHTKKLSENAQDAHEAIRVVSLDLTKDQAKEYLSKEQYQIYSLIYDQTVESMMKDALIEVQTVTLNNNGYEFTTSFEKVKFDGYRKNRNIKDKDKTFKHKLGDALTLDKDITLNTKETQGPRRFTEATIIKEMESSGIGRPSTYASTIDTLKLRKYISIVKKEIEPTEQGFLVYNFLKENFDTIINVKYTAEMEADLDKIAEGQTKEEDVVPEFYNVFMENFKAVKKNITPMETGEVCPKCGSKMVYKSNRYGRFEACGNYPNCKYIKKNEPQVSENTVQILCPECGKGHLVERVCKFGKYKGKKFFGCSNYPDCKFTISTIKSLEKK